MPQDIIGAKFSMEKPGTLPRSIYCSFSSFCRCGQPIPINELCVGVKAPEGDNRIHDFKMISKALKELCTRTCNDCGVSFALTDETIRRIRGLALQHFSVEQVQANA